MLPMLLKLLKLLPAMPMLFKIMGVAASPPFWKASP